MKKEFYHKKNKPLQKIYDNSRFMYWTQRILNISQEANNNTYRTIDEYPPAALRSLVYRMEKSCVIHEKSVKLLELLYERTEFNYPILRLSREFEKILCEDWAKYEFAEYINELLKRYKIVIRPLKHLCDTNTQYGESPRLIERRFISEELISEACDKGLVVLEGDVHHAPSVFLSAWASSEGDTASKYYVTQQAAENVFMALTVPEAIYINRDFEDDIDGSHKRWGLSPSQVPSVPQVISKERDFLDVDLKKVGWTLEDFEEKLTSYTNTLWDNPESIIKGILFPHI